MTPDKIYRLLDECTGETIWPVDHCRQAGLPEPWIAELSDAFESNPAIDRDTIYLNDSPVNQFHGIRDVDLAIKLGQKLNIDVEALRAVSLSREDLVRRIKEAVEEG